MRLHTVSLPSRTASCCYYLFPLFPISLASNSPWITHALLRESECIPPSFRSVGLAPKERRAAVRGVCAGCCCRDRETASRTPAIAHTYLYTVIFKMRRKSGRARARVLSAQAFICRAARRRARRCGIYCAGRPGSRRRAFSLTRWNHETWMIHEKRVVCCFSCLF